MYIEREREICMVWGGWGKMCASKITMATRRGFERPGLRLKKK